MGVSKVIFSRPYHSPLVIAVIFLTLYLVVRFGFSGGGWLATLLAGASTATLSSAITVNLVERTFRQQEEEERKSKELSGLRYFKSDLVEHISFLSKMYVASSAEYPDTNPSTYEELFDERFKRNIQFLDFSKEYHTTKKGVHITWFDYSAAHLENLSKSIDQTISQYGHQIEPDTVELLQELNNSGMSDIIRKHSNMDIDQYDIENGVEIRYNTLFKLDKNIEQHTDVVLKLTQKYEQRDIELFSPENMSAWRENKPPQVGSGRLAIESLIPSEQDE